MAKPRITRTFGPIHFEDLDPHRFEDLVRELIYDYKDWQSIEAVGRGGADDGYDIRAFEKNSSDVPEENDDESSEVATKQVSAGNLRPVNANSGCDRGRGFPLRPKSS